MSKINRFRLTTKYSSILGAIVIVISGLALYPIIGLFTLIIFAVFAILSIPRLYHFASQVYIREDTLCIKKLGRPIEKFNLSNIEELDIRVFPTTMGVLTLNTGLRIKFTPRYADSITFLFKGQRIDKYEKIMMQAKGMRGNIVRTNL